ncbi:MAG: hypothetical protein LJE92_12290 [Gammaproteobacteria bacterium]|jgi:hypothetical protein|nr:hypothetical protein [Gammaproteobacteria bacterium]
MKLAKFNNVEEGGCAARASLTLQRVMLGLNSIPGNIKPLAQVKYSGAKSGQRGHENTFRP